MEITTTALSTPLIKIVELYERLVQAEKDKVEYLEKLMKVNLKND
jgi:hypothetical protein